MRFDWTAPTTLSLVCLVAMLPFVLAPSIDTLVAGLFYGKRGWVGGQALDPLRAGLWHLSALTLFASFVLWIATLARKRPTLRGSARLWGMIGLVYALGPGLMADELLKRFWGRARPADVADFGGALAFTPPWLPTDQCLANCSFVSGEVAGATATAIAIIIVLCLWRNRLSGGVYAAMVVAAALLPVASAAQRMASGRHFLSDVIFAALFTLLVASLLRVALFGRKTPVC